MFKIIFDAQEVYECQKIAKSLFRIDLFSPQSALFSQQVFHKNFNKYLFLDFNDWFCDDEDYKRLQLFCQEVKETSFVSDAPSFYLLNPVRFSIDCTHSDFINGFTYVFDGEHSAKNIGLRISPETFIYGESLSWAMVNDLTHNIIIVGLDDSILDSFKSNFHEKYFDICKVVENLEAFHGGKMDNAERAIATYS